MSRFVLLLGLGLCGCATISPPPTPESARIVVYLRAPTDSAVTLVEAAFVEEGLAVASANGGVVTSMPIDLTASTPLTYRAAVLADSGGARVILSGTIRNNLGAALGASITGMRLDPGDQPLHSAMKGDLGEAWQRVVRIARRLGPPN